LRRIGNRLLRLPLGADKQDAAAAGDNLADRFETLPQERYTLLQIDYMDAVADAEDVGRHLRVPAPRVVAEMDAGFQQLAHREIGQCNRSSFPVMPPQGEIGPGNRVPTPERRPIRDAASPCVRVTQGLR